MRFSEKPHRIKYHFAITLPDPLDRDKLKSKRNPLDRMGYPEGRPVNEHGYVSPEQSEEATPLRNLDILRKLGYERDTPSSDMPIDEDDLIPGFGQGVPDDTPVKDKPIYRRTPKDKGYPDWIDKGQDRLNTWKKQLQEQKKQQLKKTAEKKIAEKAGRKIGEKAVSAAGQAAMRQGASIATGATAETVALAAGAGSGPVGWAIDAIILLLNLGNVALELLKNDSIRRAIFWVWIFWWFVIIFVGIAIVQHNVGLLNTRFPNIFGGRAVIPESDGGKLAALAGDRGLFTTLKARDLTTIRNQYANLIQKNASSLGADRVNQARTVLAEMDQLIPQMKAHTHADDKTLIAADTKKFQELQVKLYDLIFPTGGDARKRVVELFESGIFSSNEYCRGAKSDIFLGRVKPNLYKALAEIGRFATLNNIKIIISCVQTGHRSGSLHTIGLGIDFQATPGSAEQKAVTDKLVPYLYENRQALGIDELFYESPVAGHPAGFYNLDGGRPYNGHIGGHKTHVHMGVRR